LLVPVAVLRPPGLRAALETGLKPLTYADLVVHKHDVYEVITLAMRPLGDLALFTRTLIKEENVMSKR